MMLVEVLLTLSLTHVGRAANVRKQPASLRSDSGPHHRNQWPTSMEYAAEQPNRCSSPAPEHKNTTCHWVFRELALADTNQ